MEQNIKRLTCDLCGTSVDVNGCYNKGFQKVQLPCEITSKSDGDYTRVYRAFHECDICSDCYGKLWYMFRSEVAEINYDTRANKIEVNLKCDIASE